MTIYKNKSNFFFKRGGGGAGPGSAFDKSHLQYVTIIECGMSFHQRSPISTDIKLNPNMTQTMATLQPYSSSRECMSVLLLQCLLYIHIITNRQRPNKNREKVMT